MLNNIDVELETDFNKNRSYYCSLAEKVVYTGTLDSYFDFCYGNLDYRSVRFEEKKLDISNFQGVAVMNFTEREIPYTRIIEHKHFEYNECPATWISYEYPVDYKITSEPYYPINDRTNMELYNRYLLLAKAENNLILGGRLAEYRYYDMDKTIASALKFWL